MTPFELQAALDGMVCLVDTREQDTPRLRARIKDMGVPTERCKLDFGDYSAKFPVGNNFLDLSQKVAVERKMNLDELIQCYTNGRKRFTAEFERCKEANGKMYLLVESATWEKTYAGNYRSQMTPKSLIASLLAWLARYNCQIIFCATETTGKLIHDILYREGKEILERM